MNRRSFLTSTVAATTTAATAARADQHESARGGRKLLSWRHYQCPNEAKRDLVLRFLREAAIPALNRMEVKPIGVFLAAPGDPEDASVFTVAAHADMEAFVTISERLGQDSAFVDAAREYLGTGKDDPAYARVSSKLMRSFAGFPDLEVPRTGDRLFELRTYESHNEWKAKLKVEMFNEAELAIFRQVGLDGVFFGETLVGPDLPNLTYMLAYRDEAEKKEAWDAFRANADWAVLKDNERYRDTVSRIHSRMLVPAECSQI